MNKKKSKKNKYRLALFVNGEVACTQYKEIAASWQRSKYFIRWLNDWTKVNAFSQDK